MMSVKYTHKKRSARDAGYMERTKSIDRLRPRCFSVGENKICILSILRRAHFTLANIFSNDNNNSCNNNTVNYY